MFLSSVLSERMSIARILVSSIKKAGLVRDLSRAPLG